MEKAISSIIRQIEYGSHDFITMKAMAKSFSTSCKWKTKQKAMHYLLKSPNYMQMTS